MRPLRCTLPLLPLVATGCGLVDSLLEPDVPNPFLGEATLLLELSCEPATAAQTGNLVGTRMTLLGLRHSVTAHPSGKLSITTTNAAPAHAHALAALLVAEPDLGFHAVLDDQQPLRPAHDPPEEAALEGIAGPGGRPDLAFDVEAVQAMMALAGGPLPPVEGVRIEERFDRSEVYAAPRGADWQPWIDTLTLPEGAALVTECWQPMDGEELCAPLLVEVPPSVTAANVAETELAWDDLRMSPHLEIVFDEQGKAAFHALSERLVQRWLAIVSEGEVLSRPMVVEPIPGGRAWLSVGQGTQQDDLMDLWRFHALLTTGPLPGACSVEKAQPAG
jgi:hypothetical protein